MAALAPWALLRLVPLADIASSAAGSLRGELRALRGATGAASAVAHDSADWASATTAQMRRDAQAIPKPVPSRPDGSPISSHAAEPPAGADHDTQIPADPPQEDDDEQRRSDLAPLGPMWQAGNGTWGPLVLGRQPGGGAPRVWPPEGAVDGAEAGGESAAAAGADEAAAAIDADPAPDALDSLPDPQPPTHDPAPRPDPQPPADGRL